MHLVVALVSFADKATIVWYVKALYLYIPAAEMLRQWREACAQHLDIRCARHPTAHAYL